MNLARASDTTTLINTSLTATSLLENKQLMDKAFAERDCCALERGSAAVSAHQHSISDLAQNIIGISYKEWGKRDWDEFLVLPTSFMSPKRQPGDSYPAAPAQTGLAP